MLIKIAKLLKSKRGNPYATTLTGERYTFSNKDDGQIAKEGSYAWATEVVSDSTYKLDANGAIEMVNGAPVLIKREGGPVRFWQITKVFANQVEAFRAKNESKLEQVAERAFLKKELTTLGQEAELEPDEITQLLNA